MYPTMILVCGMSGAGKTTFAKNYAKEIGYTYVCPDDYYARINGDECKHINFFEIWMSMWRDIHNYELNGINIVVDTNALTKGQREQFLEWFPTFRHEMIWISAPYRLCLKNNNSRRRVIPESAMNKMWSNMEFPSSAEADKWDKITIYKNNNNKLEKCEKDIFEYELGLFEEELNND